MITLTDALPEINETSAEYLKIKCLFDSYKGDMDTLFWTEDGGKAYISLSFGDMVIKNNGGNIEELREFVSVISPRSIFSDIDTLKKLNCGEIKEVNVVCRFSEVNADNLSDELSSKDIFDILSIPEFSMPSYPDFAVDFCRRKNKGYADFWGIKDKCAAVTFNSGDFALLNGIVSKEKGLGSVALNGILGKNKGRHILAVCKDEVIKFYEKNGFKKLYKAGYQWKQQV